MNTKILFFASLFFCLSPELYAEPLNNDGEEPECTEGTACDGEDVTEGSDKESASRGDENECSGENECVVEPECVEGIESSDECAKEPESGKLSEISLKETHETGVKITENAHKLREHILSNPQVSSYEQVLIGIAPGALEYERNQRVESQKEYLDSVSEKMKY